MCHNRDKITSLTPWVMSLKSSDIPLPTLTLMVFSVYILWIVVIKCVIIVQKALKKKFRVKEVETQIQKSVF